LTGYPSPNIGNQPLEYCRTSGFNEVRVIGLLPDAGECEELGYMTVGQSSTSELVYSSIEKQIEAARIQACQWGADAIVVMESQGDKKNTWSFFSGTTYRDERESRIVAIRYVTPVAKEPATVLPKDTPLAPGPPMPTQQASVINFRMDVEAVVRAEIRDSQDRLIRVLLSERRQAGYYSETWDWRSDTGIEVRDGQYTYNVYVDDVLLISGHADVRWSPN
jgi:hypothetical protein